MKQSIENAMQRQPGSPKVKIALQTTVPASLYAFFRGQLTWLKSHGFEVHTVSAPGEELKWLAETEQVTTHTVPMTRSFSPLKDPLALWRLFRLYRKSRFTVVHSFTPKGGLLGMLAAAAAGCPVRFYDLGYGANNDQFPGSFESLGEQSIVRPSTQGFCRVSFHR